MNFEPVIGLEIHVQMKTKSKMFSGSPNSFSRLPNSEVTPFDMAFPGTMPRVNKQAVINAIRVASALHMTIDPNIRFDRKNYFYSDLPKGFQITQQFHPIGRDGYLDILDEEGKSKRIRIERIHMEEDTCKQLHFPDCSLLDYNRAGTPLVEIVSCPDLRSGTEAMHYVEAIRNIVVYSLTSDGKMEEGSLRCDVNVSLRPYGSEEFGTKVELKNLNSIKNIAPGEGLMQIGITETKMFVKIDETSIYTTLLTGRFPAYNRVIPASFRLSAEIDTKDMKTSLDIIENATSTEESRKAAFEFSDGGCTFSSITDEYDGSYQLSVEYEGEPFKIIVSDKLLSSMISKIPDEKFRMEMNTAVSAVRFTWKSDPDAQFILMPMNN